MLGNGWAPMMRNEPSTVSTIPKWKGSSPLLTEKFPASPKTTETETVADKEPWKSSRMVRPNALSFELNKQSLSDDTGCRGDAAS